MAKRANKKSTTTQWIEALDPEAIDEAREEATIDAYAEYEPHTGFMTALEEVQKFPFSAKVLGSDVMVVSAKTHTEKAASTDWTAKLDPDAVEAVMEEATVDANGADEQPSGQLPTMGDESR